MLNKQQIEEMAKTLYDYCSHYDDCVEGSEEMLAKYLIEQGWIKPNENRVILTREEYDRLNKKIYDFGMEIELNLNQIASLEREVDHFKSHRDFMEDKKDEWREKYEKVCEQLAQARKETVRELLSELFYIAHFYYGDNANVLAWAKEKARQYSLEIGE